MNRQELFERIQELDELIRLKCTGSAAKIARKFNCSERSVHRLLDSIRDLHGEVYWSNDIQSYCYNGNGHVKLGYTEDDRNPSQPVRDGAVGGIAK